MPDAKVVEADLENPGHQAAVLELVDAYARDPFGNGRPLSGEVRASLIPGLQKHPTTTIFLAYHGESPVGILVSFRGFSTFAARPLINIHDFAVLPPYRGQGVGRKLLAAVEQKARTTNCCKITLEVQENNSHARRVYEAAGFGQAVYEVNAGGVLFLAKHL